MPQKAEEWLEEAGNKMKKAAEFIHQQFAIIREAVDKKEKEMMQCLELNENDHETIRMLIHNAQELTCEMPTIIESVNALLIGMDDNKKLTVDTAEEVLHIKDKIKCGEEIINKLRKVENCETFVDIERFTNEVKHELDEINGLGNIPVLRILGSAPTGFKATEVYSVYASLCWDISEQVDEYIISMREEGGEWSSDDKLIHIDKNKDHCVVYPLNPKTKYNFRVVKKIDGMETKWSEEVTVETKARLEIPEIDDIARNLLNNMFYLDECVKILQKISYYSGRGKGNNNNNSLR